METCIVARDNSGVLTVKLGRETSLFAYSTDKRSNSFHLNGHTLGFHSQTQKLEPSCTA